MTIELATILPVLEDLRGRMGRAREIRVSPTDMDRLCRYMIEKFPRLKRHGNATLDYHGMPLVPDETLEIGEVEWIPERKAVVSR